MRRTRLTAGADVAGDRHLHALPIIAVYKHVATDLCRATCHSFIADALAIEALTAVDGVRAHVLTCRRRTGPNAVRGCHPLRHRTWQCAARRSHILLAAGCNRLRRHSISSRA